MDKLRTIYLKNHENFKNSKRRGQFNWFLWKKTMRTSLLMIITFRFTCGKRKISSSTKKSENIVNKIVGSCLYLKIKDIWRQCTYMNICKQSPLSQRKNSSNTCYIKRSLYKLSAATEPSTTTTVGLFWIDLFLDSDSFYNCIRHFSSKRSN